MISTMTHMPVAPWVPILMYHRVVPVLPSRDPFLNCVSEGAFERHLQWLARRGYRSLPLDAVDTLIDPRDYQVTPRYGRALVITFDDGYRDNYLYALPLLRRYGFTATIFLVTDAIGANNSFDASYGSDAVEMLSLDEIREMQRAGIQFGSHTCTHPPSLRSLTDTELDDELRRSRSVLERLLDASVDHFAYPKSQLDYRVEAAVSRAGYRLACAGVGTRFSRYCLNRIEPPGRRGIAKRLQNFSPIFYGPGLEAHLRWRQLKRQVRCRLRPDPPSPNG